MHQKCQSHHRKPYAWDEAHFEPYVTYVDTTGREQWLFDGFIFLESQDMDRPDKRNYTYMTGVLRDRGLSAGRAQWENLLDYWFDGERNLAALDRAVHAAVKRLGKPATKRRVVVMIPDPIIYHHWIDSMTSTTYWGELEGRRLDFRRTEDRFEACRWFIDQVRERFDRAGYRHLELAGFYWLRENIAQPQDTAFLDLTLYIRGLCGRIGAQFFSLQFLLVILVLLRSMVDRNFSAIYKEGGFTHASHQST